MHTPFIRVVSAVVPVLRRRGTLGITGQSGLFLYGVDRNKQVTWLHPPSGTVV